MKSLIVDVYTWWTRLWGVWGIRTVVDTVDSERRTRQVVATKSTCNRHCPYGYHYSRQAGHHVHITTTVSTPKTKGHSRTFPQWISLFVNLLAFFFLHLKIRGRETYLVLCVDCWIDRWQHFVVVDLLLSRGRGSAHLRAAVACIDCPSGRIYLWIF